MTTHVHKVYPKPKDKGDVSCPASEFIYIFFSFCGSCVSFVALNGNVFGIGTEITIRLFLSK